MNAALTCFAEKGYYEASMDDIVREAGLSKGGLYWHFKSKRELFQSLIEEWLNEFTESMASTLEGAESANEKLSAVVEAIKINAAARPELMRAQMEFYSVATRDAEFRRWLQETYFADTEFLEAILRQGIDEGAFRPVPVEAVARLVMAYLDGALLHREIRDPEGSVEAVLDEVIETILVLLKV